MPGRRNDVRRNIVTTPAVIYGNTAAQMKPSPINPRWVVEGRPMARVAELSRSRDGSAFSVVWDCTAGKFNWHYSEDETVHIFEGSVVVSDGHSPARRLGPGDVAFFPANSHALWHVEDYVRKVAFLRVEVPPAIGFAMRVARKAKKMLRAPIGSPSTGGFAISQGSGA
jgi:uncharacterized cupin superfamily protein